EQERGRSVWKESLLHVPDHRTPVVEVSRGSVLLGRIERPWSDAEDGAARRQHESLLRAGESDVDAPLVHSEIDRAESADDIDEEQRVETRAIDGPAHRAQVGRDSGGGLVVNDQDRAVLGSQIRFYVRLGDRVAPSQLDLVDLHAEFACSFRVEASEVTSRRPSDKSSSQRSGPMLQVTHSHARVSSFLATTALVLATLGSSASAAPSSLQSAFSGAASEFNVPASVLLAVSYTLTR